jgi:hypothetical protein
MPVPIGLNHLAMSVPPGTLTDDWRAELLDLYGEIFSWHEIDSLRLPDRMTLAVGNHTYVNIRERDEPMVCSGYEHFGIVVESAADAEAIWNRLSSDPREVHLAPLQRGDDGFRSFRFRYVLPLTVEVQYFP